MDNFIYTYLTQLRKVRDKKTVKKKEYILKHLIDYSDELPVFDQSKIFSFYEYLKGKNLKDSTIRDIFKEIKLFYEWLQ
ncbi:MAG TPA: integrase, partial [Aquificaceae bacterium]|nr:integrase [Aquificaceae bacterium]